MEKRIIALAFVSTLLFYGCSSSENKTETSEISETKEVIFEETQPEEEAIQEVVEDIPIEEENSESVFAVMVFLMDPDEGVTNVRQTPNGEIVHALPNNDDYMFEVIGAENGWLKISMIDHMERSFDLPKGYAWIHSSVVAATTRNYDGKPIKLYNGPGEDQGKAATIAEAEAIVHIIDGSGDWVKVSVEHEGKQVEGWMKADMICGNPYTTCS